MTDSGPSARRPSPRPDREPAGGPTSRRRSPAREGVARERVRRERAAPRRPARGPAPERTARESFHTRGRQQQAATRRERARAGEVDGDRTVRETAVARGEAVRRRAAERAGERDAATSPVAAARGRLYRFSPHFHPYVGELIDRLTTGSVDDLFAADIDYVRDDDGHIEALDDEGTPQPTLYDDFFAEQYDPVSVVADETGGLPVKDLDFSVSGAYALYNWELFYHVPLTVGIHLSRNGRYDEAQRWFHHIFDPTDDSDDPEPDRYWKVRPFHYPDAVTTIGDVLHNLARREDADLYGETIRSIRRWQEAPFRPHRVAGHRPTAYMLKAVMAYLDNLIAWGDSLFRQDTVESLNEATQLYVLAANLLGPRPQVVPHRGRRRTRTYADLKRSGGFDAFGNAQVRLEVDVPFDALPPPADPAEARDGTADGQLAGLRSVASPYFCIPRNDRLVGYWDTVADRLFKIRNSLDIHGVFRRLPLFDPPIDPALLARAAAAGLDVGSIMSGLHQPLPLVRFSLLVAKATELAGEVRSLGGQLLSAIEREDAEELSIIRARQEKVMLGLAEVVRYEQWQEAVKAREGVEQSFANALARYTYYARSLGKSDDEIESAVRDLADLGDLDVAALERMQFSSEETPVPLDPVEVDIATDVDGSRGQIISGYEAESDRQKDLAVGSKEAAYVISQMGKVLSVLPDFETSMKWFGVGPAVKLGGTHLVKGMELFASASNYYAAVAKEKAEKADKKDRRFRRTAEWTFQQNMAAGDISHIYKQWRAAQIREAIAERELDNHRQQMRHAEEIEQFLTDPRTGKTSSKELYSWLRREARGLYGQCFRFAYDVARKAERALQHELGDPSQTFLRFDYQAGREGLLAGEKLHLDIKRMEMAYHEQNRREYELTRHVSLRRLDPVALLTLRATGRCEIELPEGLFDLDCPGHYFRRIRSVALSIPCVVGPHSGVNATLTLQRSAVRISPALRDGGYGGDPFGSDTERFSTHSGQVRSVVTSSGVQDSGLFDANARDERYLPFEGAGAVSSWQLSLPADLPQFDHDTISDVVLHLRYTAREGGAALRDAAVAELKEQIGQAAAAGSVRLLSMRHEFPSAWARFTAVELDGETPEAPLTVSLREEHYPYWATAFDAIKLHDVELFAEPGPATNPTVGVATAPVDDPARTEHDLPTDRSRGGLRVGALSEPLPPALGELTLFVDDNSIRDLWLALSWGT